MVFIALPVMKGTITLYFEFSCYHCITKTFLTYDWYDFIRRLTPVVF